MTGTSRRAASAKASSHHGHQSTGLSGVLEQVRARRILQPVHHIHSTDGRTYPRIWAAVKLSNSAAASSLRPFAPVTLRRYAPVPV